MFERKKILVAGDFMLDIYTQGEVRRISPEAPVPVLCVKDERRIPGGAGNTILNLISLGMDVVALGRVGNDQAGRDFLQSIADENVDTKGIFVDQHFCTPEKNRMMAGGQQIVRIDYEEVSSLPEYLYQKVIEQLPQLMKGIDVVAISDYAKGFLTPALLQEIISYDIPVIVDPKGLDFTRYWGAMVLKPNLGEAIAAAGLGHEATLDDVAAVLLKGAENLMITRSSEGISLFGAEGRRDFPAQVHEVRDVTGAGDTVLAVLTAALANGYSLDEAAQLGNLAAAVAIECLGCARVSVDQIRAKMLSLDCNK
ncbi:MAG: bifunctional hydroxymethylpyrimidine kinase/phosphomethylpyrimidine kinase [Chlamydiales bacterium]|nr:bifunctional hydroxymethylpyrimidine kinase/phosphomethylpyrimidine kinase [Chlamydiales bacterium]